MKLSEILPLLEARKNPNENKRVNAYYELLKYADNPNIFISFTVLEKLGINPLSEYDTPLGVFCYPLQKGLEFYNVHNTKKMINFPYMSKQPYIQVLEWNGKEKFIHDIGKDYTDDDLNKDIEKIKKIFPNKLFNPSITSLDDLNMDIKIAIKQATDSSNPGSKFFSICRKLTMVNKKRVEHQITTTNGKKDTKVFEVSQSGRNWNTLLRLLGYSGIQDNGDGILHSAEPMQTVFLSSDAFKHIATVNNIQMADETELLVAINNHNVRGILNFLKGRIRPRLINKYPQILDLNFYHIRIGELLDLCEVLNTQLSNFHFFHTLLNIDYNAVLPYYDYEGLLEPSQHNIDILYDAIVKQNNDVIHAKDKLIKIASRHPEWQSFIKKYVHD